MIVSVNEHIEDRRWRERTVSQDRRRPLPV
jgi:hypothetical protein